MKPVKLVMEITVDKSVVESVERTLGEHHCRNWQSPEHPTQYEATQSIVMECRSWLNHYGLRPTFTIKNDIMEK